MGASQLVVRRMNVAQFSNTRLNTVWKYCQTFDQVALIFFEIALSHVTLIHSCTLHHSTSPEHTIHQLVWPEVAGLSCWSCLPVPQGCHPGSRELKPHIPAEAFLGSGHVAADSVLSSSPLGLTVVRTTLIRLHLLLIWQLHADLRSVYVQYVVACGMVYVYMFLLHESGMHDLLRSPKSISQMHATICNQKWHTVELLYSGHHRKPAVSLCRVVSPFRGT